MISMIVAIAENRAIGKDNALLWHLPNDLQYFKKVTMGKPILMGRKTYESIGRPLPGRVNVVVSRNKDFAPKGVTVVNSIEKALEVAESFEEIVIIGGASFYEQMLPQTELLYLTRVHKHFDGDTFFPELVDSQWQKVSEDFNPAEEEGGLSYTFEVLRRIGV